VCALLAAAGAPARGEAQEIRVVRRNDRKAVILLLPPGQFVGPALPAPGATPVPSGGYRLFDVTANQSVTLANPSVGAAPAGRADCPRPPSPDFDYPYNRVCIALATATLDDTHQYLLHVDALPVVDGGKETVRKNLTFLVPLPGGAVLLGKSDNRDVMVLPSIDFSADPAVGVAITVNGVPVDIVNPTRCPRPALLGFRCQIRTGLNAGDVVGAVLVNRSTGAPIAGLGPITPATFKGAVSAANLGTKDPTTTAQVYIKGGYVRDGDTDNGTLQLLLQKLRLVAWSRGGGAYTGELRPYLDVLASTDTSAPGYIHGGINIIALQNGAYPELFQSLGLYVTPRVEMDKKATVANFIPYDVELKVGIRRLFSGGLPYGGAYQVLPSGGFESGSTFRGKKTERPETDRPFRWKGGVTASVQWQPDTTTAHTAFGVPFYGFRLDALGRRYWLKNTVDGQDRYYNYGEVAGTYKFTEHIGVALTARDGFLPPLFKRQHTLDLSLLLVF
jgi:hypothetical protein